MSVVHICNRGGSQYLGLERVNNLNEGTPQSEQYQLHYDDLRRALLERHWWTFAKCVQPLARVVNDQPGAWGYKYQRPSNALSVHWINDPAVATAAMKRGDNPDSERQDYGPFIFSNVPAACIQFTCDLADTDRMPQYFRDALSAMVASAVAVALTESVSRAKFAAEQAEILIEQAVAKDEEMMPPITMPQAHYIAARTGDNAAFGDTGVWGR